MIVPSAAPFDLVDWALDQIEGIVAFQFEPQ